MSFDEFVKVHAEEIGGYAKVTTEIEALIKVDDAVLFVRILMAYVSSVPDQLISRLTHSLSFCRMLTSTRAC